MLLKFDQLAMREGGGALFDLLRKRGEGGGAVVALWRWGGLGGQMGGSLSVYTEGWDGMGWSDMAIIKGR